MFARFIARVAIMCFAVWMSVLVMQNGWGLKPLSWWWIIGVGIGAQLLAMVMLKLTDE